MRLSTRSVVSLIRLGWIISTYDQYVVLVIMAENQFTTNAQRGPHFRIAMVCDFLYPRLGGVENHIWSLSQNLLRRGHKVILITHAYDGRRGVRYMAGPLKVYYCPFLPMTDQDALPTFLATLPLLRQILIRERIHIVHAHQATSTMGNESIVYAAALGLGSIYTDHSLFGFDDLAGVILNRVLRMTLTTVDAAIAVSHTCRENLILRAHMDPSRVSVVPNAVEAGRFTPDPTQRSKERIKIVVVSRLVYRKGVDLLVDIIPQICHRLDNVDFIIGGDGNKMLSLLEMVEQGRLQDRVEFLGAVPHTGVREVLVRGHIFLNCSLTESFCIAILEAAAAGLVVVSTNVGGVPEVLPSDMVILGKPSVVDMVEKIMCAIAIQSGNTAPDPQRMHDRVNAMYSWDRVARETIQIYEKVANRPRMTMRAQMTGYMSLGLIPGIMASFMFIRTYLFLRFIEWWQPLSSIEKVPDMLATDSRK